VTPTQYQASMSISDKCTFNHWDLTETFTGLKYSKQFAQSDSTISDCMK